MPFTFVLGRESDLALAELVQVLNAHKMPAEPLAGSSSCVVMDAVGFEPAHFSRCGGLIKYGTGQDVAVGALDRTVTDLVMATAKKTKRLKFGISVYPASPHLTRKALADYQEQMQLLGLTIRQNLKAEGCSTRFVISTEPQLSSVVVTKNKLVSDNGLEVLVGIEEKRAWVGQTLAVQDYEGFARRDMGRPSRDDVSGMLPPKLARMMLNLSGKVVGKDTVVLDPFCGSGTVMQEALLLGAGKVLGSDASSKAVADAQANLDWLAKQEVIAGTYRVEQVDAADLKAWLPADFVDVAATEPFLGDPVRGLLAREDVVKRQADLSKLYDRALEAIAKVMKKDGRLVIIFPVLLDRRVPLPASMGKRWTVLTPWKDVFTARSKRGGLDYQRPGQRLGREIFVLARK
ncbi:MAG: methyltransferase domain-containing protein [Parcubacteria group bacterium]|nr:methyltransferase domain-containing protein [Parcubacteria group bacterium]